MAKEQVADSFRRWGYLQADIDPLERLPHFPHRDLDTAKGAEAEKWRKLYCGKIGAEFMHMPYPERCDWVAERMEQFSPRIDQRAVLERIASAEKFESFIHTKYVGSKWFSLEGLAALIPLLDSILSQAAEQGFEVAVIGMAHRGRLNTLLHITGADAAGIFAGFEDVDPESVIGGGDTKYHKGATGVYKTASGREIRVHLASNPSHLEAVNPVVMGRVKARQDRMGDANGTRALAILVHGDAAFAGQGVAAEALNYASLRGFSIGGTVHIIANNLIGYTAGPDALHSSRFAADIAKRLPIPIFHVNAESPDDVLRTGVIAMDYRTAFASDVVIDLIGYRRFGHNEVDDPTTTSPVLYQKIKSTPSLHLSYAKQIGVSEAEIKGIEEKILTHFRAEHDRAREITKQPKFATLPEYWSEYTGGEYDPAYEVNTALSSAKIKELTEKFTRFPKGFAIHPKIEKTLEQRLEMGVGSKNLDWGMAETLAFASLLDAGKPVRIVGQDSRRATFNHRQAVMYDTKNSAEYIPLANLGEGQGRFDIYDSMLSEAAAVGFEYGYSRDYPEALVCWEAQFGDFVNGAQIIIDQFLSAGEDKWGLLSGLTLLLPHGYEGQGPEHSSARLERFLQLAGEDNMQVAYPSTAANYFHLLRRQALRKWRKPLVVCTPKGILRLPAACSELKEFTDHSFQTVIDDADIYAGAERVLLCSGKIVHELRAERKKQEIQDTAIVAVEQLYPFPEADLARVLDKYSAATVIVWVQEEPANMGALFFVKPLIEQIAGGRSITTVRRSASASPATGSAKAHAIEQSALIKFAFSKNRGE